MQNNYSISFLVPVYNTEDYLIDCLQSIISQITVEDELIVLDDCSTDKSLSVANNYIKNLHYDNVHIYQNENNKGISITRKELLSKASKNYIWYVDSDDIIVEDAVEKIKMSIQNNQSDIILLHYFKWIDNELYSQHHLMKIYQTTKNKHQPLQHYLLKSNDNYLWNKLFKRELLQSIVYPNRRYFEDIEILTAIAVQQPLYSFENFPVIKYRQRSNSLIQQKTNDALKDYLEAYLNRCQIWAIEWNRTTVGYLYFKILEKYIKLIDELIEEKNYNGSNYVISKFENNFNSLYQEAINKLDFIRAIKLKNKWYKLHKKMQTIF